MPKTINVVGAGLVGSLSASLLAKRGYKVELFEYRDDMRRSTVAGGRSINLALSQRGWKALRKAGIEQTIREIAIPMSRRIMHDRQGKITEQAYGKEGQAIFSVSRGELNMALMTEAEKAGVKINFGKKTKGLRLEDAALYLRDTQTGEEFLQAGDICIGADGAFSKVRASLMRKGRFNYAQQFLEHGYKELSIPPKANGKWALEKNALHIWPRESFMLIALPNLDGSFTCTLFLAFEGKTSFDHLNNPEQIETFFRQEFPDALPLMPSLQEDFENNPTSSLLTVRCNPWTNGKNVALIGDAAHAIVPFYGQGMNSGFEDADVLDSLCEKHDNDWESLLKAYQQERIPNAEAIADLALYNFIEMRDNVADPNFLLRKKIESWVQENVAGYLPLYSMVTFSHLPYAEAQRLGRLQDAFWKSKLQNPNLESEWTQPNFRDRLLEEIKTSNFLVD